MPGAVNDWPAALVALLVMCIVTRAILRGVPAGAVRLLLFGICATLTQIIVAWFVADLIVHLLDQGGFFGAPGVAFDVQRRWSTGRRVRLLLLAVAAEAVDRVAT
jgi:hypothetical protein